MQEDNPGTQEDEYLDRPVDAIASQNILATVETLTAAERVAFLGSFLRFMLELAQQVNEIFVTGHSSPSADDGSTGLMLMQQGLALESRLRITMGMVKDALDKETQFRQHRAAGLRQMVTKEMAASDPQQLAELAELEAVLVVYSEEGEQESMQGSANEVAEWIRLWTERLRAAIRPPSSSSTRCDPTPIDLDTPTELGGPRDNESQHNMELYEQECAKEEADILRLVEEFEREEAAKLHRAKEQREFQEELDRPRTTDKRMRVNITMGSNGASTSTSMHLPFLAEGMQATITMRFSVTEQRMATQHSHEPDEVDLMQSGMSSKPSHVEQIRRLLQGIHPHIRARVVQKLRLMLVRRLRHGLLQGTRLVQLLHSGVLGDEGEGEPSDVETETVDNMASFLFQNLDFLNPDQEETEVEGEDLEGLVQELQQGLASATGSTTGSAGSMNVTIAAIPPVHGRDHEILQVVEGLLETLNALLNKAEIIEDYLEVRRAVVVQMVEYLQSSAARTLAALAMVHHLLPQPNCPPHKRHTQTGCDIMNYLEGRLMVSFQPNVMTELGDAPFGQQEVAALLPALQSLVVETLGFLDSERFSNDMGDEEGGGDEASSSAPSPSPRGDGGTGGLAQDADLGPPLMPDYMQGQCSELISTCRGGPAESEGAKGSGSRRRRKSKVKPVSSGVGPKPKKGPRKPDPNAGSLMRFLASKIDARWPCCVPL